MDYIDALRLRPRMTVADLVVAEVPALGVVGVTWLAVSLLAAPFREFGVAPEGFGAVLFSTPSLLLAWPFAVWLTWATWRGDAGRRRQLKAFAYAGSASLFGACIVLWYEPMFKLAKAVSP